MVEEIAMSMSNRENSFTEKSNYAVHLSDTERKFIDTLSERVFKKIACERNRMNEKIPYIPENGIYKDSELHWWTNGFWAGMMWQMYSVTHDPMYKKTAETTEERLDEILFTYNKLDHDVGFMWLHTAVANFRNTGNLKSRERGLLAASVLASRFHSKGGYIRAWNMKDQYSLIIDCLMNLPLLYWASETSEDSCFRDIAIAHLETVMLHLLRDDGSCNHVAVIDPISGECIEKPVGQGYAAGSSWSRGQSWGILGMALAYRYNRDDRFLNHAKSIAHYFMANVSMTGFISHIDFRSPDTPVYLDTTASVIAACGFLEISSFLGYDESKMYVRCAYKILEALEKDYVDLNIETDGILTHGSAKYHRESDREVRIIYGDYFLLELLLRFKDKGFLIW